MLFPPGDGFKRAMAGVNVARTLVTALCCGMMEALLDFALGVTNDRTAFGSKTIDFRAAMAAGGRRNGPSRRAAVVLCCGMQARSR
ncbi:alkylation response protein AidB-like acyl-CoA dehydrogenase [Bradyrhizobium sp. LM2.7]